MASQNSSEPKFHVSLIAGGLAGTTVDVALFPLDTLKTRLQSPQGFFKAGGFRGVYQGMQSVALGSAPGSALFFTTYDFLGHRLKTLLTEDQSPLTPTKAALVHLTAASFGEIAACLVRVPTDNVKVRLQSGMYTTAVAAVKGLWKGENLAESLAQNNRSIGVKLGTSFYRGFGITVGRDVPFAMVQFPLYEAIKAWWTRHRTSKLLSAPGSTLSVAEAQRQAQLSPLLASLCGSVAGGVAAAVSTPLDVARTRLMLGADAQGVPYTGGISTLVRVYNEGVLKAKAEATGVSQPEVVRGDALLYKRGGLNAVFTGITPRVTWISIGGCVFFGAFETYKYLLRPVEETTTEQKL